MQSHELGFFLTKKERKKEEKKKRKAQEVENDKSLVHKIRPRGRRGKGTAESFSLEKIKASTAEGRWMRNPV